MNVTTPALFTVTRRNACLNQTRASHISRLPREVPAFCACRAAASAQRGGMARYAMEPMTDTLPLEAEIKEVQEIIAAYEVGETPRRKDGSPFDDVAILVLRRIVAQMMRSLTTYRLAAIVNQLEKGEINRAECDRLIAEFDHEFAYHKRNERAIRKDELRAMLPATHRRLLAEQQRVDGLPVFRGILAKHGLDADATILSKVFADERKDDEALIAEIEEEEEEQAAGRRA